VERGAEAVTERKEEKAPVAGPGLYKTRPSSLTATHGQPCQREVAAGGHGRAWKRPEGHQR
jgi:hypothetical protein